MRILDHLIAKTEKRLRENVEKRASCWIWCGGLFADGYGRLRVNGKTESAHRVSWALHNGPIPEGMCSLHKCDVHACINPEHLFLGTNLDNTRDMVSKGRNRKAIGEAVGGSILTADQALEINTIYKSKGYTQEKIARAYGVSASTVAAIATGRKWKHVFRSEVAA